MSINVPAANQSTVPTAQSKQNLGQTSKKKTWAAIIFITVCAAIIIKTVFLIHFFLEGNNICGNIKYSIKNV